MQADGFSKKNDVYNTSGCLTRGVKYLVTALFAVNEIYPMTDKKALEILGSSRIHPKDLMQQVNEILSIKADNLTHNVNLLKNIFSETKDFAKDIYKPYYNL